MSEYKGWKLDADGNFDLSLLTGLTAATLPDGSYALRLDYVSDPSQAKDEPSKLQLKLGLQQLGQLIDALRQMKQAPRVEEPSAGGS